MIFEGKRYFEIGRGDTGVVYRAVSLDDPDPTTVIKCPVSKHEIKLAEFWASKNCNSEDNYSAGPYKVVEIDKQVGLQMADLGDTTYDDCSHRLSVGETVLMYLMLVHSTLRLTGILLRDTAYNNCICRGKEQDFKIYLVDTRDWDLSYFSVKDNFGYICKQFELASKPPLSKIQPFLKKEMIREETLLAEMLASCETLSNHFLYDGDVENACDYHDRVEHLLHVIRKETQQTRMRLQAFDALHAM